VCNPGVVWKTLACYYASAAVNWFENKVNQFTAARTPCQTRAAQSRGRCALLIRSVFMQRVKGGGEEKNIETKQPNKEGFPKWLRYLLILLSILYIIAVMFKKGAPPRQDFPSFH
jgi:hypothetical protein